MTAEAGFVSNDDALRMVANVLAWPCGVIVAVGLLLLGWGIYYSLTVPDFDPQPRTVPGARTMTCAEQTERGDTEMVRLLLSDAGKHVRLEGCP
jgi:hypothetical protein